MLLPTAVVSTPRGVSTRCGAASAGLRALLTQRAVGLRGAQLPSSWLAAQTHADAAFLSLGSCL